MQELLLAVWKAIPSFRLEAQPSTFIYRVTHNAAMTWQRTRRNYRRKVEQFSAPGPVAEAGGVAPDAERLAALYAAIRALPPLDRSLILLFSRRPVLPRDGGPAWPQRGKRGSPAHPAAAKTSNNPEGGLP